LCLSEFILLFLYKSELSTEYNEKICDIGKWLSLFFGLPFLPQEQIEECFVEDIMSEVPTDNRCVKFVDYVLVTYIMPESRYPPSFWAQLQLQIARGQVTVQNRFTLISINYFIHTTQIYSYI